MNICFNVLHQRLIRGDSVPLIEGSKDYIHCTFTFSEDWTTLGKAALFSLQGDSKTYVAVIDNNSCKIPDAVCQSGGRCEMALIGAGYDVINALSSGSTDELKSADVIITTNRCELRFGETVTVNTVNEDESEENPFADVLAKITALSDSYESKQNKTDDALTTKDKNVVGAINETHSKAWDAMSAAETALSNTSINEMLMGSLDNLTTQEKSTIVGAINEINSNKQAEDFVVTGEIEVVGGDSTKLLEGVNISATYEEIVEAYNAKKNVIFAPFVNEVNATLRVPLLSYADETILFSGVDLEGNTFMFVCQSDNTWNGKWYSLVKGDEYYFTSSCDVERRSNNKLYFLGKEHSAEDIIEEYKKGKQVRLLVSELVDKSYLKLGYFELTETDASTYCIFSRNVGLNTYFRIHVTLDTYEGNYFTFPLSSDVQENYIITCTASDGVERINGKELYIDNVSATFEEIINAYEEGKNIKLLFDYEGSDIIADFVIKAGADDIGFCVTIPYLGFIQIDCHPYNGWSGYITYVVKKNEINNLETQIGDINTALETALNGGVS